MATMQGITGKLSGKMGSAVFRVREGAQIVSQYNPIVKNPNTAGQQTTRAKFKLMSQLAAVMAPAMGSFIIKTRKEKSGRPSQRNMFTSINFPLISVSEESTGVTAKIPMENLKLTSSTRYLGELTLEHGVGILTAAVNSIGAGVTSVRMVLVSYPTANGVKTPTVRAIVDVPVADSSASYNFEDMPSGDYTVLTYGIIPTSEAAERISIDSIHTPADEDFIGAVQLDAMVSDGLIQETMTIGANETLE